ncbi:WHG domain-containing protein [Luteipulveratus sp. YIM 133132]|uniref:WHG domain-containing protein n=1 Tax=Luteipulveratus flavus TaxID=3031728 RepID=A0ABT6C5Q4_9MICO|nr:MULTISPECIES: TetR/AcrR family transcriptional regulator [unclassified Luteipulveratus]MDE9366452.1 WHG domain-containing protein [Luteipulveratus sp. YIM 133132]MDF8264273.1 WHG domain-containing protein [Luteipulveratus sp. YIM 133296]
MSAGERRVADRQQREDLIVERARTIAESEGWAAVTTRRLADEIGRTQPVLYSHFQDGKAGIMRAVALQGCTELAVAIRRATAGEAGTVAPTVQAYLDFARRHPAVYDAIFSMPLDVEFGGRESPEPMRDAFAALADGLDAHGDDPETWTEVAWSALHGLAVLSRDHRLRPRARTARISALVELLTSS